MLSTFLYLYLYYNVLLVTHIEVSLLAFRLPTTSVIFSHYVCSKPWSGSVIDRQWDVETVTQDLGSHLEWQLSSSRGQSSGGMVEMVSRPSDGWIHCPRLLDGWLRMRDGWPEMVVTRLCRLMASMAIIRLIGYQRRTDSNHCQSDVLPPQCT